MIRVFCKTSLYFSGCSILKENNISYFKVGMMTEIHNYKKSNDK